jgi:hypothetical protein
MWQVSWYVQDRVIFCQVEGEVTADDLRSMNDQMRTLAEKGQAPVHIILEFTRLKTFPKQLTQLRDVAHILRHRAVGWILAVGGQNPLFTFIGTMVAQIGGKTQFRMVNSVESAYSHIQEWDDTLASTPPASTT